MKKRVFTTDVVSHIGEQITIYGFVHALRVQSKIVFLVLRDVRGTIQCVVFDNEQALALAKTLSLESVVAITGIVKEAPQVKALCEIAVNSIEVLSLAHPELPIPVVVKGDDSETEASNRLDHRWLDLRKPEKATIFKIWTALEKGMREYWLANDFIQVYTPAFMSTPSESGAEVFEVDYFDRKAYLAQSPQFYKQMAIASGFERVFMVGPVFRAEHSFTSRHLTEFTGWDFEVAYIEDHNDLMDLEEGMLRAGFASVREACPELEIPVPEGHFPRLTMLEAKAKLKEAGVPSLEEHDLSPEEEREIARLVKEETGSDFVFITEYHVSKSAFYHMRTTNDNTRSRRADLLYRGLEITTLAQREHRPEVLAKQAEEKGMSLEPLTDYINFFKYGCPPHGGAGLGPGRIIQKILELPNIREATFLPRDVKRLNP